MITISKMCVALLSFILLFSVFVANFLSIISLDGNFFSDKIQRGRNYTNYLSRKYEKITNTKENIIWFLQISDIHVSIFRDPSRITQFKEFCEDTVKVVKPLAVVASGDLTDAKTKDNMGSKQQLKEWEHYYNTIKQSGVMDYTTWLDTRGNHDNFDVRYVDSSNNYFRKYSVQGQKYPKSYLRVFNDNKLNVAFLNVDACPEPGLRRPFNFIGYLTKEEQLNLIRLEKEASERADHIIWFGHYPTSTILWLDKGHTKHNDFRELVGNSHSSITYLCGHLHTMGGIAENMYSIQKEGFLELELSDWKDNREYRLGAIDHGLFTFVDQKHGDWPLILVTNPKSAYNLIPGREPTELIKSSTHVRLLAYSNIGIKEVKIRIEGLWKPCENVDGPLYACKWDPEMYRGGVLTMEVMVEEKNGYKKIINHLFSLDNTVMPYEVQSRILLMSHALNIFQAVFATLLLMSVVPLCILRILRKLPGSLFMKPIITKIWLLTKVDRIFFPLILYASYLPMGPWAIGELIEGHIGAIFAWGIFVDGTFLPGVFTYAFGALQLLFVHIPMIFILSSCIERRIIGSRNTLAQRVWNNIAFICVFSLQMLLAYFFLLAYGTMAFILGPLRTWSVVLNLYLWFTAVTLPVDNVSKAKSVLGSDTPDVWWRIEKLIFCGL